LGVDLNNVIRFFLRQNVKAQGHSGQNDQKRSAPRHIYGLVKVDVAIWTQAGGKKLEKLQELTVSINLF